jgi:hypothetical protein
MYAHQLTLARTGRNSIRVAHGTLRASLRGVPDVDAACREFTRVLHQYGSAVDLLEVTATTMMGRCGADPDDLRE